jgi:hypothetical protein
MKAKKVIIALLIACISFGAMFIFATGQFTVDTALPAAFATNDRPTNQNYSSINTIQTQLVQLGKLDGPAQGVAVQGNYAYIATGTDVLQIVDISNPASPHVVGEWECEEDITVCYIGTTVWRVDVAGDYAFVRSSASLYVIDISNPTNPQLANQWFLDTGGYPSWTPFTKDGHKIYTRAANFDGTLRIDRFDVSDPLNLVREATWTELDYGSADLDLAVQGDYMYIVSFSELTIYDISSDPVQVSSVPLNSLTDAVAIVDNYVYVGDVQNVHIIDVSDPTEPVSKGQIDNSQVGFVIDLHIDGDILYVSQKYGPLKSFSIENREQPVFLASYPMSSEPNVLHQVRTQDEYVYATDGEAFYILTHESVEVPPGSTLVFLPTILTSHIDIPVASLLTPFDANLFDLVGPSSWATNYGKIPEIVVASDGVSLHVLAHDYNSATPWRAVLLRIEPTSTGYAVTQALTDLPMLDRIMGLAVDASGNRYYATAVNEASIVDPYYPPANTYRNDIVRVVKVDPTGTVLFNVDLDIARHAFSANAEMIINPMTASSARLAVGGNEIALVHGINTGPDWNIGGRRHQKALSTRLDATTGDVTRVASVWVSHSFDQRLLYDGEGIIEHHLGDAYPRYLVFGRNHTSYPLFHIKGDLGENNTRTRLGNIALIENDPAYGYIALFATESSSGTGDIINGPRNLAIVRVHKEDNSIDPALPDTLTVISNGVQRTNRLKWLTTYSSNSNLHAERPKLVGIGADQYIVLWEEWSSSGSFSNIFNGVYAMRIDDKGTILQGATLITTAHHLHRGDDAFLLDGRAAWMTGSADEKQLHIHFVDASLAYEVITLD